ncbi:MAG: histone deacetylase family protein [Candidatus Hadarchaeaceae archaeon]
MTTALVYSEKYLEHNPGEGHPERPERLKAIVNALKRAKLWGAPKIKVLGPKPAKREDIELVHDPNHIELVERLSKSEKPLDGDTPVRKNTYELALLAAGGTIDAGRVVLSGDALNAFALVRPPGHHAGRNHSGGFCYFNNLAIAVKSMGLRTLILDIDCHAGNGTMDIFWGDNSVLYLSLHQWPCYPGVGWWDEIGEGTGKGFTINLPLYPNTGDDVYLRFVRSFFPPLVEQFKPELIGVSAGFDAHRSDPLTQMNLSSHTYYKVGKLLHEFKVLAALEGGYNLDALSHAVPAFLAGMRNQQLTLKEGATFTQKEIKEKNIQRLEEIKKFLSPYWSL